MAAPAQPRRASDLRRARMMTQDEWVASALSNARLLFNRAWDSLPVDDSFGDDDEALREQARVDSLDLNDLELAEAAFNDASRSSRTLFASAERFGDAGAAASLRAAARELQDAALNLRERYHAFEPHVRALAAAAREAGAAVDYSDMTMEQDAVLKERRPELYAVRRGEGSGQPYWTLSEGDLELVFEMYADWKWPQRRIADVLGCSTRKLRELLHTHGLMRPAPDIAGIEAVVKINMECDNTGIGIRKIVGELTVKKVPFTWASVAEVIRTVDPVGRSLRMRQAVPRVVYNVRTVNGMWHFDGYEHLVSWKICEWRSASILRMCVALRRNAVSRRTPAN